MVQVVVDGVAAGSAVVVGLAKSSPDWWQKVAAATRSQHNSSSPWGEKGGEERKPCFVHLVENAFAIYLADIKPPKSDFLFVNYNYPNDGN